MKLVHHDLETDDLKDEWWDEAGMADFVARSLTYRVEATEFPNFYRVRIEEVEPVHRELSDGIFNDDKETGLTARERVISILQGFREDAGMSPIKVVRLPLNEPYRYKLFHGVHRFYCSLAAGFTHVPVVERDLNE